MTIPGVVIASLAVLLILLWTLANWRFAGVGSAVRVFLIFALLAWMQISVARLGFLREWGIRPVPVFAVMFISVALVLWRVFSRLGGKLSQAPLVWLIGFQAFRFPLELALHKAFVDGLMPVQMSYSGLNFDIVIGISAMVVAALAHKGLASKWLVIAWNAVGTILLFVPGRITAHRRTRPGVAEGPGSGPQHAQVAKTFTVEPARDDRESRPLLRSLLSA